jgi:hypothetical protein
MYGMMTVLGMLTQNSCTAALFAACLQLQAEVAELKQKLLEAGARPAAVDDAAAAAQVCIYGT